MFVNRNGKAYCVLFIVGLWSNLISCNTATCTQGNAFNETAEAVIIDTGIKVESIQDEVLLRYFLSTNKTDNSYNKIMIVLEIAKKCLESKRDKIPLLLSVMTREAEQITHSVFRAKALYAIGGQYVAIGEHDDARRLLCNAYNIVFDLAEKSKNSCNTNQIEEEDRNSFTMQILVQNENDLRDILKLRNELFLIDDNKTANQVIETSYFLEYRIMEALELEGISVDLSEAGLRKESLHALAEALYLTNSIHIAHTYFQSMYWVVKSTESLQEEDRKALFLMLSSMCDITACRDEYSQCFVNTVMSEIIADLNAIGE